MQCLSTSNNQPRADNQCQIRLRLISTLNWNFGSCINFTRIFRSNLNIALTATVRSILHFDWSRCLGLLPLWNIRIKSRHLLGDQNWHDVHRNIVPSIIKLYAKEYKYMWDLFRKSLFQRLLQVCTQNQIERTVFVDPVNQPILIDKLGKQWSPSALLMKTRKQIPRYRSVYWVFSCCHSSFWFFGFYRKFLSECIHLE